MNNKKYLYALFIIIPIIIFFVARSFSLTYTQEIRNVEIESNDYDDPGSWHIDKSAKWTGSGKAQIEFNVETVAKFVENKNIDIILVFDISGSMSGDKFTQAISDAKDLTNAILSQSGNRMALITFDTDSEIVSDFSSDKDEMIDYLDSLQIDGATNYNAALLSVDEVLDGYTVRTNTDLVTLFLTDGYPNTDTPAEKSTYRILKDKYPYMAINGIQYEIGEEIIQDIIDITDNQWSANQETLNNILFEAAISPVRYESFVISDYIDKDYFTVNSVNDIEVSRGQVELTTENGFQKVIWTLDNNISGFKANMKINVDLKSEYHETDGFYPTNDHETIDYNLYEEDEDTVNSTLTPVLKNNYYVIYDTNGPSGCTGLPTYQNETHYVYQTVNKKIDVLTCPGYVFKGWQIENNNQSGDIRIINDDTFIMPGHDVTIRGTWTKEDLVKSMDGTIRVKLDGTLMRHDSSSSKTFGKSISRDSFESITTVDNIDVPGTAIDSWDCSTEKNGSVIAWYTDVDQDSKYELYIGQDEGVKANPDSSYAFYYFRNVATIDLTNFDITNVTNMNSMFSYSGYNATTFEFDLSGWDTSKVTIMSNMFNQAGYNATIFDIGNLSEWDTSQVTSMGAMFSNSGRNATTWNIGDLSEWDTSRVTSMSNMFNQAGRNATTWNIGDLSEWDTSKVTNMNSMFNQAGYNATTWNIGDLSEWDTPQVTQMNSMFSNAGYNASSFDIGNLSEWDTSNVTSMNYMFSNAGQSATTWNIGDLSGWNTSQVTSMSYMFQNSGRNATAWNIGDLSGWDTSKVTSMSSMFNYAGYRATTFDIGDLGEWDTSKVTDMSYMFQNSGRFATTWNIGDLSGWDTSQVTNMGNMFDFAGQNATTWNIGDLSEWDTSNVTYMSYMFARAGYKPPTFDIGDLSEWDTSNVKSMSHMFESTGYNATTYYIGDLSGWDTSKVTNMGSMFYGAGTNATTFDIGDLSEWDTSKVTDMSEMFYNAGWRATTWNIGDLSGWDTSSVNNMKQMFYGAGSDATTFDIGDLSEWDTSKVTNMSYMFASAGRNATTFDIGDLSEWDTSKVTDMSVMFHNAGWRATTWNIGDLSGWDTSNVTSMSYMFSSTGQSATTWDIGNLSGWDTSKVTNMSYMFSYAGKNATTWNSIGTLKVYATDIQNMFNNCKNAKATLNIYSNPTTYSGAFTSAATTVQGSEIKVNYSSATTNIDNIIATKSSDSNVVKGIQLD